MVQTRSQTIRLKNILLDADAGKFFPRKHILNSPNGSTPRPPGSTPGSTLLNFFQIREDTVAQEYEVLS